MKHMYKGRTAWCAGCTLMGHTFYMCRLRKHADDISLQTKCKRSQLLSCELAILSGISIFPTFRQPWLHRLTPNAHATIVLIRWLLCSEKDQKKQCVCHTTMKRQWSLTLHSEAINLGRTMKAFIVNDAGPKLRLLHDPQTFRINVNKFFRKNEKKKKTHHKGSLRDCHRWWV